MYAAHNKENYVIAERFVRTLKKCFNKCLY